jgi:hypothetical protein
MEKVASVTNRLQKRQWLKLQSKEKFSEWKIKLM